MSWTLTVEDFGRIEKAEIDVRPGLLLFVGENSTGKSYLTSLLWGIVALQVNVDLRVSPEYADCLKWVEERVHPEVTSYDSKLTTDESRMFASLFEDALQRSAKQISKGVFNSDTPCPGGMAVRASEGAPVRLVWGFDVVKKQHDIEVHDGLDDDTKSLRTSVVGSHEVAQLAIVNALARRIVFGKLTRLFSLFENGYSSIDPIYMPASRTGFMLTYKSLARSSMQRELRGANGGGALSELTIPAYHFMDMLMNLPKETAKFSREAELLEQAIEGSIVSSSATPGALPDYRYRMRTGETLAMSHSSSLVTEVAPILLVLRRLKSFPLLVLEEPEAHLHPKVQRTLARVIARLVNKGVHVWITTHSTTFCQQINNLLKLGSLPEDRAVEARRRWEYEESECLTLDQVGGYQLMIREDNGRTAVDELKKTERGLVMPSFNRPLTQLAIEVDDLDRRFGENE